jgi:hypothetical protein
LARLYVGGYAVAIVIGLLAAVSGLLVWWLR